MSDCSRGWVTRCPAARGPKCSCACGGANHGTDHDGRPQTEAFPSKVARTPSPSNRRPVMVPEYVVAAERMANSLGAPMVLGPMDDPYETTKEPSPDTSAAGNGAARDQVPAEQGGGQSHPADGRTRRDTGRVIDLMEALKASLAPSSTTPTGP